MDTERERKKNTENLLQTLLKKTITQQRNHSNNQQKKKNTHQQQWTSRTKPRQPPPQLGDRADQRSPERLICCGSRGCIKAYVVQQMVSILVNIKVLFIFPDHKESRPGNLISLVTSSRSLKKQTKGKAGCYIPDTLIRLHICNTKTSEQVDQRVWL